MLYIYRSGDISIIIKNYGIDAVIGDIGDAYSGKVPTHPCKDIDEFLGQNRILISGDCQHPADFPVVEIIGNEDRVLAHGGTDLNERFFQRDAAEVAVSLLGKIIVHRTETGEIMGKIVETEAYYGPNDPASRAYHGKKDYNSGMWLPGGHIFIYMVHANWMFNITTDNEEPQAVLIRAVEPLAGLHIMRRNRGREKIKELCSGPGKWTRAFGIKREHNGLKIGGEIRILESPWDNFEIVKSHRIGVREDLPTPLRFYIAGNKFVSKR